ncbi:MAG: PKD domain-containing protein [Balneola sp.]
MNYTKKYKLKALLSIVLFSGLLFISCKESSVSGIDDNDELKSEEKISTVKGKSAANSQSSSIIIDSFDQGAQSVGTLTGFSASTRTGRDLYEGAGPIGNRRELAGSENSPGNVDLSVTGSSPGEMVAAYRGSSTHSSLIDLRYGSCSDPILSGQKRSIVWGEVTCDPTTHQLNYDLSGLTSFEIDFSEMQGGSKWFAGIYLSSGTGNNFLYREFKIPFQATPFTLTISASSFSGITEADLADIDGIIVTMGNNGNVASGGNVTISEVRANVESTEPVNNVYVSSSSIQTYDPIFPASEDRGWTSTVCYQSNNFGLTANWVNPHNAFEVTQDNGQPHPWDNATFDAAWINSYNSMNSDGPGGHNWSKYETEVSGNGEFVIQLLADNCSWVYLANENGDNPRLVGYQAATSSPGEYGVTLDGTHQLTFVIFDGGGLAGGKFRLETTEEFGGTPPPIDTNTAPVADAGADQTLTATGATTSVTLDGSGSSDADGDVLTYSWSNGATGATPTVALAKGTHVLSLTVSDGEESDTDEVTITVVNTIPVADAGADQTIEAIGATTTVTLNGSATDADGDALTYSWSNGAMDASTSVNLAVGTHTFTLTVTDEQGATDSDQVTVTITDTTAPVISFNQETNSLWPPNHKMVLVATGITASDIVDGTTYVRVQVASSESSNGKGDGNTDSDYDIRTNFDGSIDVYVRAERSGKGKSGRTYTITMTTGDNAGNSSSDSFQVSVAKSQGRTK